MAGDLIHSEYTSAEQDLDAVARAELRQSLAVLASSGGLALRLLGSLSGFAGQLLGRTMTSIVSMPKAGGAVQNVAEFALRRAFDIAVIRLQQPGEPDRSRRLARPVVILSGAVGGFVGLPGFLPDATVTSLAIMREIARVAQQQGEDLNQEQARAACLQVFALTPGLDGQTKPEMNYFSTRLMMQGRPLALLFTEIASRYGLSLSQKFALQAVPILGAIGGASLNSAFLHHYREVATAHFTIRRLERIYGPASVQAASAAQSP